MNYLELIDLPISPNLPISPKVLGIANKEAGWTPFTALLICLHHRITLVSLQRRGFINYLELINLPISPKVLGIANKEAGWTPFTALLIRLHHPITLVSPIKKGIYKLFRAL